MLRLKKSRINYLEKFQQMIDGYNSGSRKVEIFFADLVEFAQKLNIEDKRTISEKLTEEELAIFDLLTQADITLTEKEKLEIKKVAKELLSTLKQEKLVLDWRRRQQTKAAVKVAIEEILARLPESYSTEAYQRKCQEVYQHVYECYSLGRAQYLHHSGLKLV
jgi:type I restriction enzyme R subunit